MSEDRTRLEAELAKLEQALSAQEALRGILPDEQLEATLAALQEKRASIQTPLAGARGVAVGGDVEAPVVTGDGSIGAGGHVIFAREGATVVIGEAPVAMTAVDRQSALGRYLHHVISRNRYLQLQGIRSGGRLVHIELDRIYVTLRATRQRMVPAEEAWLAQEALLAPGEVRRSRERPVAATETVTVSVNEALAEHSRLAVLGDPGSGKTTLLRYLALLYARDLAEGTTLVKEVLGLDEAGRLPILLPLRQIGAFLRAHHGVEDGTEGHALLLDFLLSSLKSERIELPDDFFDDWLVGGNALILLDGLDEVPDADLRRRVSRLVEAFSRAYPACRYVVSSRIVGYAGAARLGEEYATTTIRDFTMADVERFLTNWHRLVAIGQMGPGESAEAYAASQTRQLLGAIKGNERVRELAINPLMLTVIAMVHRDRVKLPDRRAELYAEAVDVLLGKWEEAKGVVDVPVLEGQPFDTGDKRLMLQSVALRMHEGKQKEVPAEDLHRWLEEMFRQIAGDGRIAGRAVDRFLRVIEERTGLLIARGEGVYAFSHLTFQEYLAALAVAARDDYVDYTLARAPDPWWREVVLLQAGHLSTLSKERTTRLIQAIADGEEEPEPYHNLVLAAECLRDVGGSRVQGDLEAQVRGRIRAELETPLPSGRLASIRVRLARGMSAKVLARRRVTAAQALSRIGGESYWTLPHGEPEWIEIPAGEFWMGTRQEEAPSLLERFGGELEWYGWETPQDRIHLPAFAISRVPITNAQYQLFVEATDHKLPEYWEEGRPPKELESHPVVNVSWHDALAYCRWLSEVTGMDVTLPSEAEWEKAARGDKDRRVFPWGNTFDATRCNSTELALGGTAPVGIFPGGASPYGVLDMAGNVWQWTRSLWGGSWKEPEFRYPYNPEDGRENLEAGDRIPRVLRGGSFGDSQWYVRCACRGRYGPDGGLKLVGFRVVVAPVSL